MRGEKNIKCVKITDPEYPKQLRESKHAPETLYYVGDMSALEKCVAVIGKRDASEQSLSFAHEAGRELAARGYAVLNGLAIGCDKSAAEGAIEAKGKVISVMPCGLDEVYPQCCEKLAESIITLGGCLISEYHAGVRPEAKLFVERDKIQAALANCIISVCADLTGGTMHTLRFAKAEGKRIGCFVDDNPSEGDLYAIKTMGATKINNLTDLMRFVHEPIYQQMTMFL